MKTNNFFMMMAVLLTNGSFAHTALAQPPLSPDAIRAIAAQATEQNNVKQAVIETTQQRNPELAPEAVRAAGIKAIREQFNSLTNTPTSIPDFIASINAILAAQAQRPAPQIIETPQPEPVVETLVEPEPIVESTPVVELAEPELLIVEPIDEPEDTSIESMLSADTEQLATEVIIEAPAPIQELFNESSLDIEPATAVEAIAVELPVALPTVLDTPAESEAITKGPTGDRVTWRASAMPNVSFDGNYRAVITENPNNRTMHYNQQQGRFDGIATGFPFEVVVRNVGVEQLGAPGQAPSTGPDTFVFAGVQVHAADPDNATSAHIVVGHRGSHAMTVEAKSTINGSSNVNDLGPNQLPNTRADLRIIGNADKSLTVYWQTPNPNPGQTGDRWQLYAGSGNIPAPAPSFGDTVYVGLITYAHESNGLPIVGVADSFELK